MVFKTRRIACKCNEKLEGNTKQEIIEYFRFENMVKNEPDFCPLYKDNKKCHDMEDLNCYLCACPHFRFDDNGFKKILMEKYFIQFVA